MAQELLAGITERPDTRMPPTELLEFRPRDYVVWAIRLAPFAMILARALAEDWRGWMAIIIASWPVAWMAGTLEQLNHNVRVVHHACAQIRSSQPSNRPPS